MGTDGVAQTWDRHRIRPLQSLALQGEGFQPVPKQLQLPRPFSSAQPLQRPWLMWELPLLGHLALSHGPGLLLCDLLRARWGLRILSVGTRAVFSSLLTEMSFGSMYWVESQSSSPHACDCSPHSPFFSSWAQVPSFFLFLYPSEQWKKQSPVFGCRDAFLRGESQTMSTTGLGIFTGGQVLESFWPDGRMGTGSFSLFPWEIWESPARWLFEQFREVPAHRIMS